MMKFKSGNLYAVSKENHGDDTWGFTKPYCLLTHKFISLNKNDIFLFLETCYLLPGTRLPTNKTYKIFLNGNIHCFGAEQLNESGCKSIPTDDIKNKNSIRKIGEKIINLFV